MNCVPPSRCLCLPLLLLLPVVDLPAQGQSSGLFVGVPAAISVDNSTLPAGQMLLKQHGFQTAAPPPAALPGVPSLDLLAVLQTHGAPAGIDIDDFSLGLDWVLADDSTGRIQVPVGQWGAITFSVTRTTQGAPGSRIALAAAGAGGAGGDVFSYVLPGSALPAPLVDQVERVHSRSELGLTGTADVDALDHLLPIFALDPRMRTLMPQFPTVFFTLSSTSATQVPATWFGGTPPSGATVLWMQWTAAAGWSPPRLWKSFREFGLLQNDDIDGLAIDEPNQRVLFSTRNPAINPIRFLFYGTDMALPVDYKKPDGTPVSTGVGLLNNDDIDAICSMDPAVRAHGSQPNPMFFFAGTPVQPIGIGSANMSGSAFRNFDANTNQVVFDTWLVGWPQGGRAPGFAAVFLTFGQSQAPVHALGPLFVRDDNDPVSGNPQRFGWRLPLHYSLQGHEVVLRWAAVSTGQTSVEQAWPSLIRI